MAWSAVATQHVTTRRAPGSKHTTNTNATKTQKPFGTRRLGTQVRDEGAQGEACPKPRSSHTKWGGGVQHKTLRSMMHFVLLSILFCQITVDNCQTVKMMGKVLQEKQSKKMSFFGHPSAACTQKETFVFDC